jgi:type IV pilus assembly protein PilE
MKQQPFSSRLRFLKNSGGFTLIEVMVVVAIVGILASVAYPSYMSQVRKSRRSDAVVALSTVQQSQERWRANNSLYSNDVSSSSTGLKLVTGVTAASSYNTSAGYYTIALSLPTQTGYVATARAITGTSQASDSNCLTLTVTVVNGTAMHMPDACWSK